MFLQGFFAAFATLEDLRYPLLCLFLLLEHQLGTDIVLGRYLLERLFPFQGSTIAPSLVNFGHVDECVVFFKVILHSSRPLRKLS